MQSVRDENASPEDGDYLSRTAETLLSLSQECMDLGVAERLRRIASDMARRAASGCETKPSPSLG